MKAETELVISQKNISYVGTDLIVFFRAKQKLALSP